jgi:hypothetical protein
MMPHFDIAAGMYAAPTPGGVYHATLAPDDDPPRRLLRALMTGDDTPALSADAIRDWSGIAETEAALEVYHRLQSLALVQADAAPRRAPMATLEELLPTLLAQLARSGKALLADAQGFYLATSGFPHETAEELSALSADLGLLHERHQRMLRHNLGLDRSSWALIDAAGNSQLGVWPLFIGSQRFALVASGTPQLNQPAFVDLVWALTRRYASLAEPGPPVTRAP